MIKIFSKDKKGITLIALVVTIIVLLILAGVSLNLIAGSEGIIAKARWSEYVTEYEKVDEAKEMYVMEEKMKKYDNKRQLEESIYPIKEKMDITGIKETLKTAIMLIEEYTEEELVNEEKVNLYKVDFSLLNNIEVHQEYVINIVSGMLYSIEGEKYKGNVYHTPRLGVTKEGTAEPEEPEIPEGPKDTEEIKYLIIGESKELTTKLKDGEVEWSTSDESVVTVDQTGKIIGIAKGEASITISYKTEDVGDTEEIEGEPEGETEEGEEEVVVQNTQTYKIIVEEGIPESFSLQLEDREIGEYQTGIIEAKIEGKKIGSNYVEWESSDGSIVKINGKGEIKGLKVGEATIKCKWKDDETKEATCRVRVKPSENLVLDKTKINIGEYNDTSQMIELVAKYKQTDITETAVWKSEDENIVTVGYGKVYGKSSGTTKIIAEYQGETAVCEVTVKNIVTEIYTIDDLKWLAVDIVNNGKKYGQQTVTLMNDIDFKNEASYLKNNSFAKNLYYTGTTSWDPIGETTSKYFDGIFEGNGNTISNLYINAKNTNQGLFGFSKDGTFKNLNLKDVNIISTSYQVGGILGNGSNVNISNCKVSGTINSTGSSSGYNRTGGIVGLIQATGGNITNCTNEATVGGNNSYKGGIVGQIYKGTITNCVNKGNITSNLTNVGGIVGWASWYTNANYTVSIDNCKNYGEITRKK